MSNAWDRLDPDFGETPDWRSSRITVGSTVKRANGKSYKVSGVWYATDTNTLERLGQVDLRDLETKKRHTVDVFTLEAELAEVAGKTVWQRLGEGAGEEQAADAGSSPDALHDPLTPAA